VEGRFSFLTSPAESPGVEEAFEASLESDGYVPNYVRVWCWRPEILEAFAKLRADVLAGSTLSEQEIAVMVTATASALGDSYCSLAWGERLAQVTDGETAAAVIRGEDAGLSRRAAALAGWSRAVVDDPNGTTDADLDRLREAGLDEREIFEATVWIGLRLGFSTINDALGTRPDWQLFERVPMEVRDAVTFGRPADRGD
jgi:uncharacterized peroxidase-related enzyme